MFWNKLRNYVETVDGYLIRKDEAKKVIEKKNSLGEKEKTLWYRKENAPNYDYKGYNLAGWRDNFYKTNVPVKEDGTPIGYISREEHERIVEEVRSVTRNKCMSNDWNTILKKAGRPKGSKNNKK